MLLVNEDSSVRISSERWSADPDEIIGETRNVNQRLSQMQVCLRFLVSVSALTDGGIRLVCNTLVFVTGESK